MIGYITAHTSVAVESNPQSYQYKQIVVVSFINSLNEQKFSNLDGGMWNFFVLTIQIDIIEHVK